MPVYAFRKTGTDQVKIGVSTNVQKRLRVLQHAGGNQLQEIFSVDSDSPYRVERALHQHYGEARLKDFREWFALPVSQEPQLIADMQRFAADSPKALHSGSPEREDEFAWLREPMAEAFAASQITEEELAAWANVPISAVLSILEGRARLTSPRVQRIAERLNIELVAVVSESREVVLPEEPGTVDIDAGMRMLARLQRSSYPRKAKQRRPGS